MDERHVIVEDVPLVYGDAVIGRADLLDDGSIHARVEWTEISMEMRRMVDVGLLESLSLVPNFVDPKKVLSNIDEMPEGMIERIKERLKPEIEKMQKPQSSGSYINTQRQAAINAEIERMNRTEDEVQRYVARALELVYYYVLNHLEKTDSHVVFTRSDVYLVWFCKTLQNWKALLSTTLPDGMYYEVTYDGDKKRVHLDAYKKFENVVIPDSDEAAENFVRYFQHQAGEDRLD